MHRSTGNRLATDDGGDYGQSLPGEPVDAFVSQWGLTALAPAALPLSLEAAVHLEPERRALDQLWHQRLERTAYEAERAARHDRLIEPAPRLVGRQLANDWEDALLAHRQRQEEYARVVQAHPQPLSRTEREALEPLAQNIPALWHAPTTTMAERKEMVRQIIQRGIVAGEGRSARLQMTIEGVGGGRTAGLTTRPMSRIEPLSDDPRLCERIRTLVHAGYSPVQITALLAHEGFCSPTHARPFSRQSVIALMRRLGVHQPRRRRRPPLPKHEWWLSDLEREVGRSNSTLHQWRTRGWRRARWHDQSKRWGAWADAAELQRLQQRGALPTGEASRHRWLDAQRSQSTGSPRFTAV